MEAANRFWKADLTSQPRNLSCYHHHLLPKHANFGQPPDRWLTFLYLHRGILGIGARAYPYEYGTWAIIPPGVRCSHDIIGPHASSYWMEFELPGASGVDVSLPLLTLQADPQWLIDEIESAKLSVGRTSAQHTAILWATLWRHAKPLHFVREHEELYDAEKFILDNLDRQIRVEEVADRAKVSTRTILRMFRQAHGLTVEEYIRTQKVEVARRLLATTELPIKVVAGKIGIQNYQHFNKLIREATGLSPNAYREHALLST